MLAVTRPVASALKKRCDAWHLRLDKLSFDLAAAPEAKTNALLAVRDCYRSCYLDNTSIHRQFADRCVAWLAHLERQHADRYGSVDLVAASRLLLHLGRANVLENVGLYAERTTGLPLIPGTALKGVVSTWACWSSHFNQQDGSFNDFTLDSVQRWTFASADARLAAQILGDDRKTGSELAGQVIFLGGFPASPPRLELDIVNPHRGADGQDKTRLTPSVFLCLEPGTRWRFAFYVRPGAENAADLVQQTRTWIEEALTQTGIGAKTAAGYGRFRTLRDSDLAAERKREADAKVAAQETAKQAEAQAAAKAKLGSDYPNPATFKNRVLDKLAPALLDQLNPEVPLLQKPENANWREQLKKSLAQKDYKDARKRLRDKDWFPKEWLPPQ